MKKINSHAQVWVETVIYTLIGLAVIGILLAVAKPKIDSMKDKLVIDQSIDALNKINEKIYEVQRSAGNRRVIDLKVAKGKFVIDYDSENPDDMLYWEIESKNEYSEPGVDVPNGKMIIKTIEANPWKVTIQIKYAVDIRFNNQTIGRKELEQSPTPYSLSIENIGTSSEGNLIININEI